MCTVSGGFIPTSAFNTHAAEPDGGPSGPTVTLVAAGTCTIAANQAGNNAYSAAPQLTQSFEVNKASQTITFAALANKTVGDPAFGLSATATSDLAVTFSSTTPAVCTITGSTVTLVAAGTCTITANRTGDNTYTAALPVMRSFTVAPASTGVQSQTISFGALTGKTVGDPAFTVSATASSGLAVSFRSSTPGVCTVSGSTVTLAAAGTCTITASQSGNATCSAALPITRLFTVQSAIVLVPRAYLPMLTNE